MKTIYICGLQRSGSTACFNIVRLLFEHANLPTYAAYIADYQPDLKADIHIVKGHGLPEPLIERMAETGKSVADFGFTFLTSHRDLRDAAASAVRMGWVSDTNAADYIGREFDRYLETVPHSVLDVKYETFRTDPTRVIKDVGKAIGLAVTDDAAHQVQAKLEIMAKTKTTDEEYDKTTLLLKNHIGSGDIGV
ncbi:MAG: hypothetical protein AAF556_08930, partial [Pseudomonadota bacterium]